MPQAGEATLGAVDRYHIGAGGGELRGLAPGCGAEVGNGAACKVAKQARGQRGCCVLHPPGALRITRQQGSSAMHGGAHRAGRQDTSAEPIGPVLRVALDAEIERGLLRVRGRNGVRRRFAVAGDPARHEPGRRIERRSVDVSERLCAFADHAPKHGVDKPRVARGALVALHQPHRKVDGGVVGHIKPQDLRRADEKRGLHARCAGGNAALEKGAEHTPQRAQPPQHRRRQRAYQRAVAIRQDREIILRGPVLELLVERTPAVQDAFQNVGREAPGGKPRRVSRRHPQGPRDAGGRPHGPAGSVG